MISSSSFPIQQNKLYKSAKFPNSDSAAAKSDDIYIDCKPTGAEGQELYKAGDVNSKSRDKISSAKKLVNSLKNSGPVQFLVSIIVSVLLIWVIKKAFFVKKASIGSGGGGGGGGAGASATGS